MQGKRTSTTGREWVSDRVYGVALAVVFAVIGCIYWGWNGAPVGWPFVVSGALLVAALLTPALLSPLNLLLARIVNLATPSRYRRTVARVICWNALLLIAGLLLIALAGEAWFRLRAPFLSDDAPRIYVPGVGRLFAPNTEVRFTDAFNYWTTTRTNSLGFLDREPPDAERAAASCHIAIIGDSFVEARSVAVEDKFQVRLEAMAARELPRMDITTSGFGYPAVGQMQQLPFYGAFAQPLLPNLVVLAFVNNDFLDNHPGLWKINSGLDPDVVPHATARRADDGSIYLVPPNPDGWKRLPTIGHPLRLRVWRELAQRSMLAQWVKRQLDLSVRNPDQVAAWAEEIAKRPHYKGLLDGWSPAEVWGARLVEIFGQPNPPPAFRDGFDFTAFALDEFKRQTERDGANLIILATHTMGPADAPLFERMAALADERGIPVVSQYDYIAGQGGKIADARLEYDHHWGAQGHQWAAAALLEWVRDNPQVCDD